MPTKPWIFTSNTFEVSTQGSNIKMLSIATDTEAKLQAESSDPDINVLYTGYFPVYDSYRQICINYDVAAGNYKGKTLNFENLMKTDLPKQVRKWEGKVRSIYAEDSPEEVSIFPNKRDPFLQGTYEDRIGAVGSLAADTNAVLVAYANTVLSYYNLIFSARDVEQNKEGLLGSLSDTREQQRLLVATELYGVLGGLMRKFKADPQQITRFFDLSLLRETADFPRNGLVAGNAVKNIIERNFQPGTQLLLKNTGSTPLMFCLSATKDGACTAGVIIPPNSEEVHSVSDLGDTANSFLNVSNQGAVEGSWEVDEA